MERLVKIICRVWFAWHSLGHVCMVRFRTIHESWASEPVTQWEFFCLFFFIWQGGRGVECWVQQVSCGNSKRQRQSRPRVRGCMASNIVSVLLCGSILDLVKESGGSTPGCKHCATCAAYACGNTSNMLAIRCDNCIGCDMSQISCSLN